jgi:hypothetical protein
MNAIALGPAECLPAKRKRSIDHAFTSDTDGSGRGGRSALAGQPLHTNAGNDQVHLERSGSDRCGFVAT